MGNNKNNAANVLKAISGLAPEELAALKAALGGGSIGTTKAPNLNGVFPFRLKAQTGSGVLIGESGTLVTQSLSGAFYSAQLLDLLTCVDKHIALIAVGEGKTRDRSEAGVPSVVKKLSYADIEDKGNKVATAAEMEKVCVGVCNTDAVQKAAVALSKALREAAEAQWKAVRG